MGKKELQKKSIELQILAQYITQLQQQVATLSTQINELQELEKALTNIKEAKLNTPLLSSLGSGIFLESDLKNNKEVLVNVGQNIIVKKPVSETKELIKQQIEQLRLLEKQFESELDHHLKLVSKLEEEITALQKQ